MVSAVVGVHGGLCDSAPPTTVGNESAGEIIKMVLVRETQTRVEDLQPLLVFVSGVCDLAPPTTAGNKSADEIIVAIGEAKAYRSCSTPNSGIKTENSISSSLNDKNSSLTFHLSFLP